MIRIRRTQRLAWVCFAMAVLGGGLAFGSSLKGKLKKNVYYSPANNFSVPVPSGLMGMRVNDDFDEPGIGLVSFHDDFGNQQGIHYMVMPAGAQAKLQAQETRDAELSRWLKEFALPVWFLHPFPNSRVIHEASDSFEGMTVLLAKLEIPEGSSTVIFEQGKQRHMDSRRGLVIFTKGRFIYMLTKETVNAFTAAQASKEEDAGDGWKKFAESLKPFYKTIVFTE